MEQLKLLRRLERNLRPAPSGGAYFSRKAGRPSSLDARYTFRSPLTLRKAAQSVGPSEVGVTLQAGHEDGPWAVWPIRAQRDQGAHRCRCIWAARLEFIEGRHERPYRCWSWS